MPDNEILKQFFAVEELDSNEASNWGKPAIGFNLAVFIVIKFILEVIAISSPIPTGVFTPTFVLGAAFGRLYGLILKQIFGKLISGTLINEATYSIIGAACVTSSVTRTLSVAMIVFELNGELTYMIPMLLAVLLSYSISNSLAMSIFDVLLDMKDLPYLPALRSVEHYHLKASDIMSKNFLYLTTHSELSDIIVLLQHLGPRAKSIPVVQSEEDKVLLYSVQAQSLRKYLFSYYNTVSHTFDPQTRNKLNKYFHHLYSISGHKMKGFGKNQQSSNDEAVKFFNPTYHSRKVSKDYEAQKNKIISSQLQQEESMLKIREFNNIEMKKSLNDSSSSEDSIKDNFWIININYDHEMIEIDKAPFTVFEETNLAKIHFLFTMLNMSQLFVIRRGILVGIITKNEFLKKKRMTRQVQSHEDQATDLPIEMKPVISLNLNTKINEEEVEESPVKPKSSRGRKLKSHATFDENKFRNHY